MTNPNQEHIDEFRSNDGRLGGQLEGADMLLLHHVGAKSGDEHVCPLTFRAVEGGYAVFGSNYGQASGPAWVPNLRADPDTTVEVGTETVAVRARIADGEERDRIWDEQIQAMPVFAEYTEKAGRVIPVVVLERV
ncbi:MAG: nitroreductase/quinone reductase family protein [Chloroflexota bacterium]